VQSAANGVLLLASLALIRLGGWYFFAVAPGPRKLAKGARFVAAFYKCLHRTALVLATGLLCDICDINDEVDHTGIRDFNVENPLKEEGKNHIHQPVNLHYIK